MLQNIFGILFVRNDEMPFVLKEILNLPMEEAERIKRRGKDQYKNNSDTITVGRDTSCKMGIEAVEGWDE